MWGNRLGWTISAAIVFIAGGALALFAHLEGKLTAPTQFGRDPANLAAIRLPVEPHEVIEPTTSRDAGSLYRHAIDLYQQAPARYEALALRGQIERFDIQDYPALRSILEARACDRIELFVHQPEELVGYLRERPMLEALRTLGRACNRIGMLHLRAGDPEDAARYLQAGFTLGARLYEERLTFDQLEAGLGLMGEAAPVLGRLFEQAGDAERFERLREFEAHRMQWMRQRMSPTLRIVRSIDADVVGRHVGDIFVLATDGQERLWRVEAILAMGRMQYFIGHGSRSDQRAASRLLRRLASDRDPVIRAAASAARSLTLEQYRAL